MSVQQIQLQLELRCIEISKIEATLARRKNLIYSLIIYIIRIL